jgi:hypothetical protein
MKEEAMSYIEVIRELPVVKETGAQQVLVKRNKEYFVVSSVYAMYTGFETLVFPADESGEVTNWVEVAGGHGVSRDEAIAELGGETL